jgi:hypothetical protein
MSAQVRRLDERFASAFVAGNDARLGEKALSVSVIRSSSRLANRIERREPSFRAGTLAANDATRYGRARRGPRCARPSSNAPQRVGAARRNVALVRPTEARRPKPSNENPEPAFRGAFFYAALCAANCPVDVTGPCWGNIPYPRILGDSNPRNSTAADSRTDRDEAKATRLTCAYTSSAFASPAQRRRLVGPRQR